jgi:hypothetical protein
MVRKPDKFKSRQKSNSKAEHGPAFGGVLYSNSTIVLNLKMGPQMLIMNTDHVKLDYCISSALLAHSITGLKIEW